MIPHKNSDDQIEWFEHPAPTKPERTLVQVFVKDAGMGNQIFELFGGYSIAKRLGMHYRWSWNPSTLREFGLTNWGFAETRHTGVKIVAEKLGQGSLAIVRKCEDAIKKSSEKMVGICSPLQAEECFGDCAEEVRGFLQTKPFDLKCPEGCTPVGVQVRRGDYVQHSRLNVTTPEYFLNALKWMRANVKNPHFFVVSDDPAYCTKLFERQVDVTVMPAQEPHEGIRTLEACEAHVCSNSTFGWWGAWLGESGPVIVPEHWHHQPGSYGNWNPVPDRWIKLPIGQEVKQRVNVIKPSVVTVLPKPEIERAIVFPWHADQAQWQELRFALRSIEKHFEDKKCPIMIFGTRRPGFIRENDPRVQYRGAYTYAEALAQGVQVADKVAWWNDDCLLLKPTTWADCETPYYLKDVGPDFLDTAASGNNPWREGVIRVLRQLKAEGITDQKVFSTHLPYVWEREKALEVFEKFGIWEKIAFELCYFHLHPERAKLLTTERTQELPNNTARFLNYTDRHLTTEFKAEIVKLFPDAASWEVAGGKF